MDTGYWDAYDLLLKDGWSRSEAMKRAHYAVNYGVQVTAETVPENSLLHSEPVTFSDFS